MNTKRWGTPLWLFIHLFCNLIHDSFFIEKRTHVLQLLHSLLNTLPCPYCDKDTQIYLKKHDLFRVRTKTDLIQYFFDFHNHVNRKLKKSEFFDKNMYNKKDIHYTIQLFKTYYMNYISYPMISVQNTIRRDCSHSIVHFIERHKSHFL
jgi:hypothetical protein